MAGDYARGSSEKYVYASIKIYFSGADFFFIYKMRSSNRTAGKSRFRLCNPSENYSGDRRQLRKGPAIAAFEGRKTSPQNVSKLSEDKSFSGL